MTDFITINTRKLGELTGIGTSTVRCWLCNYNLTKYTEGDSRLYVTLTPSFVEAWTDYMSLKHYNPRGFKERVLKMYQDHRSKQS